MAGFALDYEPRDHFVDFHRRKNRFGIMVVHRRGGKTVACIADLILKAIRCKKKNAKFAYIAPFRAQAKEVAWQYLKDMTEGFRKGPPRESELRVRLPNDATITIYGADNPDAFRGTYMDGCILDEYGDMRASLWNEVILPCLMDRKGWAVIIGTVKGTNHFHKKWDQAIESDTWFSFMLKESESDVLDEETVELMKGEMTPEAWDQEMECNWFAAIPGRYYAEEINQLEKTGQIGNFPWNPHEKVYCSADIGFSDSTAWWFWQLDEQGPILIDYEEDAGRPLSYYFDLLEEKPYDLETVWLPHDAKATSFQTGRTTIEQFLTRGLPCKMVPRQKVQHGIDAGRLLLPTCRIDANACYAGIEALRSYRRQFNAKTQQYDNKPLHDWASNGADAFRYFALVTARQNAPIIEDEKPQAQGYCLEELFQERENWRQNVIRL